MVKRMALLMALAFVIPACSDRDRNQPARPGQPPAEQPGNPPRNGSTEPAPAPGPQSSIKGEKNDQEVTRNIREAITSDESLSPAARNVTVSAAEGVVTLRGEVKTEQEKSRIESIAQQTAGVQRVENELEVAS